MHLGAGVIILCWAAEPQGTPKNKATDRSHTNQLKALAFKARGMAASLLKF